MQQWRFTNQCSEDERRFLLGENHWDPSHSQSQLYQQHHHTIRDHRLMRVNLRKFCLTKGFLFDQKSALQKVPFQLKIKVLSLKNALFANLKYNSFLSSAKLYVLRHVLPTFSDFPYKRVKFPALMCLIKGLCLKTRNGTPVYKNRGWPPQDTENADAWHSECCHATSDILHVIQRS